VEISILSIENEERAACERCSANNVVSMKWRKRNCWMCVNILLIIEDSCEMQLKGFKRKRIIKKQHNMQKCHTGEARQQPSNIVV
jgi:hypothetical protein